MQHIERPQPVHTGGDKGPTDGNLPGPAPKQEGKHPKNSERQ